VYFVSDRTVALSNVNQNLPAVSEMVKWKTNLSVADILLLLYIDMQVNFGLEISMNDTNYLISS
jgi:hypothetical protein